MARVFDSGAIIDPAALSAVGLLGKASDPVVVLERGDISKAIHVKAHRVSETARKKIEAAGGSVELLPIEVNRRMPRS
jgi:large subunit ribosomal protein L15